MYYINGFHASRVCLIVCCHCLEMHVSICEFVSECYSYLKDTIIYRKMRLYKETKYIFLNLDSFICLLGQV